MIAVCRWYWCDKCETHAYPSDAGFQPTDESLGFWDCDDGPFDVVIIYRCLCGRTYHFVKHFEDAHGDLWPDYVPPSAEELRP